MMKFLKFFFAIIALGCVVELCAYFMGRTTAMVLISGLALLMLAVCAIIYSRASARSALAASNPDTPFEFNITVMNQPVMLKSDSTYSGRGAGSSVRPINQIDPKASTAAKAGRKASMM